MNHSSPVYRLVCIAAMTAILEVAKFALNAIANVELISLLVIVFTRKFGWRMTMPAVFLFALLECMWWGVSLWTITYFYVWPILAAVTAAVNTDSAVTNSLISGIFGLSFGALCSLVTLVLNGPGAAVAWWIAGIPYDLVHGAANFVLCMLLFHPLMKALSNIEHHTVRSE